MKRTLIIAGGTAAAARRLEAARKGQHGLEIRTIEQVAQRLAGGFLRPVDGDTLARAADEALRAMPAADLGDLQAIAGLPGLPGALAATLNKAWLADIDLAKEAAGQPGVARLATIAKLEQAVLDGLPNGMLRPGDLARRAVDRLPHAPAVLGPIELDYLIDVAPCWRLLLMLLHRRREVFWRSGAHVAPSWWIPPCKDETHEDVTTPTLRTITCATARHEVIEAMRWARGLLATGTVQAGQIAFAAASPGEYDDLILALGAEASLDIHFAHGRRALTSRDGQAAAALADVLLHGLSQDRVRRLARLAHADGTPFGRMPDDWLRHLPRAAPLASPVRWRQIADMPADITAILLPAIDLIAEGTARAAEAGEMFLRGTARLLWRRALLRAPATALEASLGALRLSDTNEAATSIGWMHAATLACCPRPYVWLLGLNARTWPRSAAEDPLLPNHIIPASRLDPLPLTQADRLAFRAIRGTTAAELVCCASRRDATGRLLGLSPLMPADPAPERLRRARIPEHAMSEQDRMMARPGEFASTPRSASANACWQDWNTPAVTAHDGAARPGHPVLARALSRVHSATSLRSLLRNPLGFTWQYALGWKRARQRRASPWTWTRCTFGSLVHDMLEAALPAIRGMPAVSAEAGPSTITSRRRCGGPRHHRRRRGVGNGGSRCRPQSCCGDDSARRESEAMATTALSWPLDVLSGPGEPVTPRSCSATWRMPMPGNTPWDTGPVLSPSPARRFADPVAASTVWTSPGNGQHWRGWWTTRPAARSDPGTLERRRANCSAACMRTCRAGRCSARRPRSRRRCCSRKARPARYAPARRHQAPRWTTLTEASAARHARSLLQLARALPGPDAGDDVRRRSPWPCRPARAALTETARSWPPARIYSATPPPSGSTA